MLSRYGEKTWRHERIILCICDQQVLFGQIMFNPPPPNKIFPVRRWLWGKMLVKLMKTSVLRIIDMISNHACFGKKKEIRISLFAPYILILRLRLPLTFTNYWQEISLKQIDLRNPGNINSFLIQSPVNAVCVFFFKDYPHIIYIFVIAAFKKWIDICISFILISQENGSRSSWLSGQPSLALLARSDWRRRWQPRTYWACVEQCPGWPIKLWLRVSRVGDWWPRKTTEDWRAHCEWYVRPEVRILSAQNCWEWR